MLWFGGRFLQQSVLANSGRLVYALDDTYIHLAMAKNIALHGTWGITSHEFSSSTSSPLFTLVLGVLSRIVVRIELLPLILNGLFASAILVVFARRWARVGGGAATVLTGLLLLLFLTPLVPLILTGMEHTLHILLSLLFVGALWDVFNRRRPGRSSLAVLFGSAALLPPTRYEALFLVFMACLVLLLRGRWKLSLGLGACACLLVVPYGIWGRAHGWFFLPNSLLIKGQLPSLNSWWGWLMALGGQSLLVVSEQPHLLVLLAASLFLLVWKNDGSSSGGKVVGGAPASQSILIVFAGTVLLHTQFAKVGGFYRYEAYLVALGVFVLGLAIVPTLRRSTRPRCQRAGLALLILLGLTPMMARSAAAMRDTVTATHNIYEQQYQMGLFVKRFFDGEGVIVNDIGAVAFLAEPRLLDLVGLGSIEVARARLDKTFTLEFIADVARQENAQVAILYPNWFPDLPPGWVEVARWWTPGCIACGGEVVAFYALDREGAYRLIDSLVQFESELPSGVRHWFSASLPPEFTERIPARALENPVGPDGGE